MLRCTLIALLLAGCAGSPPPVTDPVESAADVVGPVTDDVRSEQPVESAKVAGETVESDESAEYDGISNEVTVVSENFVYSMTLRLPNGEPDIRCGYGKRTGSHVQDKHCRTTRDAQLEREEALEFFDEARRRGH